MNNNSVVQYFNPSDGTFENAEFTNLPITQMSSAPVNILEQLNKNKSDLVNEEFNLRNKLYENQEAFHDLDTPEVKDEEISKLEEVIVTGQQMLKNEILNYSKLKDALEELQQKKHNFHDNILTLKRTLMFVNELSMEDTEIKQYIEEFYEKMDYIDKKFITNLDKDIEEKQKAYAVSTKKLVQLKNVYQVLKNTDICYTCPICLKNPIESFLMPCGHCLCMKCMSNVTNRCFLCRRDFQKKCTLYFN